MTDGVILGQDLLPGSAILRTILLTNVYIYCEIQVFCLSLFHRPLKTEPKGFLAFFLSATISPNPQGRPDKARLGQPTVSQPQPGQTEELS